MNIEQREKVVGWFFILPTVIGFILFLGAPFILSIYYSFTKGIGATEFVGFENYKSLLASSSFQRAALNTIRFIGVGVPLITVISLFFAFLLNMKGYSFF